MQQRSQNRSANHRQPILHNTSISTSKQKQPLPSSFSLTNASNNQLKQIIQKLITKSRSLIASLETTLKQLEQVRLEKDFWKGHYFAFKTACEKCINSRGIAPFQYINELERTVKEWTFKKEEEGYSSVGTNQGINLKVMSLANSQMKMDFRTQVNRPNMDNNLYKQLLISQNIAKNEKQFTSSAKHEQYIENTEAKTPTKTNHLNSSQQVSTIIIPKNQSIQKSILDSSFIGIRLGHTNNKNKNSPPNFGNAKGLDKTFRRKDSIETKRMEIFSFAHHKNNSKNLNKTLELKH